MKLDGGIKLKGGSIAKLSVPEGGEGDAPLPDNALTSMNGVLRKKKGGSWIPVKPSELYSFISHTFTPCGASGKQGPSLSDVRNTYGESWVYNKDYLAVTHGIQLWTVPATGTYRIEAAGAQGGGHNQYRGGYGAVMRGHFYLEQGQVLKLLVGQRGGYSSGNNYGSGGGGGSFVTLADNTPMVVAGGGGGAGRNGTYTHGNGGDAPVTNTGTHAGESSGTYGYGNGAGFVENGEVALSFINGGTGGEGKRSLGIGGFGGGAGNSIHLGGGGGGYSGGIGGTLGQSGRLNGVVPTGGGSFNAGEVQSNSAGANSGEGYISVVRL